MARREEPAWGWRPEQKWAHEMETRGAYFRKNALVIYRCRRGCLLGFAWPALLNAPPDREDGVARRWRVSPVQGMFDSAPMPDPPERDWKFYAYRHIDPEIEVMGDPTNINTVGWAPAGSIAAAKQGVVDHWHDLEGPPPTYDDAHVTGERDVVRDVLGCVWRHEEKHPPLVNMHNPPGLVNCRHVDLVLDYADVIRDMGRYRPRQPIVLPYE